MARPPTHADFQRHLDVIVNEAGQAVRASVQDAQLFATQHGAPRSNRVLINAFESADNIHKSAVLKFAEVVGRFTKLAPELETEVYTSNVFDRLNQLERILLTAPEGIGLTRDHTRFYNQYADIFRKRADGLIKDIEIGFFENEKEYSSSPNKMRAPFTDNSLSGALLIKLYNQRHQRSWVSLPTEPNAIQDEQKREINLARQLREKGLIDFTQPMEGEPVGMARITAKGVDLIEAPPKQNEPSPQVRTNFAPDANFLNLTFSSDTFRPQSTPTNHGEVITRLDAIEHALKELRPLAVAYEKHRHDHPGIGHNGSPLDIEDQPFTPNDLEDSILATQGLREELKERTPKITVLGALISVLKKTVGRANATVKWAMGICGVIALDIAKDYVKGYFETDWLPTIQHNIHHVIIYLEALFRHLPPPM